MLGILDCAPLPAQELDLTGSREFLTKETAEELLAPMLAPGAKITKVRPGRRRCRRCVLPGGCRGLAAGACAVARGCQGLGAPRRGTCVVQAARWPGVPSICAHPACAPAPPHLPTAAGAGSLDAAVPPALRPA